MSYVIKAVLSSAQRPECGQQAAIALDMDHLTVSDLTHLNRLCRAIEPMMDADGRAGIARMY